MTDVQELRAREHLMAALDIFGSDKGATVPMVAARKAIGMALLDAPEARDAAEARVVKLREALADMIPGPLCGDSFVPPIPDTKFLSLDGMTWGKLRRARQALKDVGDVE